MSKAAIYLSLVAVSVTAGFLAGAKTQSAKIERSQSSQIHPTKSNAVDDAGGDSEDSDSESEGDGDLANVKADPHDDVKLVLVVRSDLKMTPGKIAAQCSHATLACYKALSATNPSLIRQWERAGQTKVAVRCESEDDMLLLQAQAQSLSICARSIQDAGRTQIAAGSRTVLGVGPGPSRVINQITGKLKLL